MKKKWRLTPANRLLAYDRAINLACSSSFASESSCLGTPVFQGSGMPHSVIHIGRPHAASRAGAIPEVCGDAAVLFDPEDPEAIAAAILEANEREDELRAKGLARAAAFTWEETARRHEAVYEAAATGTTRARAGTSTTT